MSNYFKDLYQTDVTERVETKKQGNTTLSYLSWAWAWAEVKKFDPNASYKIITYGEDKKPYLYDNDLGYMVSTEVTINDITHTMWLPVLNGYNKAMKNHVWKYDTKFKKDNEVEPATMFDINTSLMRCLVKNIGMHGLGLYIYAGEDIPTNFDEEETKKQKQEDNKKALDYVIAKMNELVEFHGSRENVYALLNLTEKEFLNLYKSNTSKLASIIKQFLSPVARKNNDKIVENVSIDQNNISEANINEPK